MIDWQPPCLETSSHQAVKKRISFRWLHGYSIAPKKYSKTSRSAVNPFAQIFGSKPGKQSAATEIVNTHIAIWRCRKKYMDYWNSTKDLTGIGCPVDVVITPTYSYAGVVSGKLKYLATHVLDYTVDVISVTTTIDKDVDVYPGNFGPLSEVDSLVQKEYDPEIQHGAPVGLSILGRRYQDEKVLGILNVPSSS